MDLCIVEPHYFFSLFSMGIDFFILRDILTGIATCVPNTLTWCWAMAAGFKNIVGIQESPGVRKSFFPGPQNHSFPHLIQDNLNKFCYFMKKTLDIFVIHINYMLNNWWVSGSQHHLARKPFCLIIVPGGTLKSRSQCIFSISLTLLFNFIMHPSINSHLK